MDEIAKALERLKSPITILSGLGFGLLFTVIAIWIVPSLAAEDIFVIGTVVGLFAGSAIESRRNEAHRKKALGEWTRSALANSWDLPVADGEYFRSAISDAWRSYDLGIDSSESFTRELLKLNATMREARVDFFERLAAGLVEGPEIRAIERHRSVHQHESILDPLLRMQPRPTAELEDKAPHQSMPGAE